MQSLCSQQVSANELMSNRINLSGDIIGQYLSGLYSYGHVATVQRQNNEHDFFQKLSPLFQDSQT